MTLEAPRDRDDDYNVEAWDADPRLRPWSSLEPPRVDPPATTWRCYGVAALLAVVVLLWAPQSPTHAALLGLLATTIAMYGRARLYAAQRGQWR